MSAELIGRTLDGRYLIEAMLGQGGFGAVYRARHVALGRAVAIKIVSDPRPELLARFRREAQLQASLRHPALVELLDFAHDAAADLHFLVQAYVPGETLGALVTREGPLAPELAAALIGDVLAGLDAAHAEGVVHRDIKPDNIMVVPGRHRLEGRLLDFGISKQLHGPVEATQLTATGMILGTPGFMSPEQTGAGEVTGSSDLYAVGAVLYYALSGRMPFTGSLYAVLIAHRTEPVPPLPPTVPRSVDAVVQRAMAKLPEQRFPSADDMRRALADAIEAASTLPATALLPEACEAAPDASPEASPPGAAPRRRRWLAIGLPLAAIALATVWLTLAPAVPERMAPADAMPPDAMSADAISADAISADAMSADVIPADTIPADAMPPDAIPADAMATDAMTTDTTPAAAPARRPPPATRPGPSPGRAAPTGPERAATPAPAVIQTRFERHLEACRCTDARRALDRLATLDPSAARAGERRYVNRCQLALDGSCLTR